MFRGFLSLVGVSLLAGILWRLELHARWGWASLDWIGQFHWAIPIASIVFLAWVWVNTGQMTCLKRSALLGVLLGLAATGYFVGSQIMFGEYGVVF